MAASTLPPLPPALKTIQHYLKTATEHEQRDQVVAYYCQLYAMQKGMSIDMKTPDCRNFLVALMGLLEKKKTDLSTNEAIHNEVVGQAHVENYALKVFLFADNEDRAGRFSKNVVKSFYTAGMLFDVLTNFGELSEDIEKNRKYAKWKAAYIHRCLKNGETPVPGPLPEEGDDASGDSDFPAMPQPGGSLPQPGTSSSSDNQSSTSGLNLPGPSQYPMDGSMYNPGAGSFAPPTTPQDAPRASPAPARPPAQPNSSQWAPPPNPAGIELNAGQYQKAMKLCKYASSALQYEDSKTAIENLTKALRLLQTGSET